jgi:hypothetical protein
VKRRTARGRRSQKLNVTGIGRPDFGRPFSDGTLPSTHPLAPLSVIGATITSSRNSRNTIGYFGPQPPVGDQPHRYTFQVLALDTLLDFPAGADRAVARGREGPHHPQRGGHWFLTAREAAEKWRTSCKSLGPETSSFVLAYWVAVVS